MTSSYCSITWDKLSNFYPKLRLLFTALAKFLAPELSACLSGMNVISCDPFLFALNLKMTENMFLLEQKNSSG